MNWIAEQFQKLKVLVEEHVPATNKRLEQLEARVATLETTMRIPKGVTFSTPKASES